MTPRIAPLVLAADPVIYTVADPLNTIKTPTQHLRNVESVGIYIDQIAVGPAPHYGIGDTFGGVALSLRYRGEPITNGWVPVRAFCHVRNDAFDGAGYVVVRLSKPFYLPPGEFISVSVSNPYNTNGGTVNVMAQGRIVDDAPPTERWLPYFASYAGPVQDGTSNAAFASASTTQDLGNPFDQDLLLERLIGRVLFSTTPTNDFQDPAPLPGWGAFNVRISDDKSRYWVPTPTPIHLATNVISRSWRVNNVLGPKSFLRVEVEGTATWAVAARQTQYAMPLMGMVGYRRIA